MMGQTDKKTIKKRVANRVSYFFVGKKKSKITWHYKVFLVYFTIKAIYMKVYTKHINCSVVAKFWSDTSTLNMERKSQSLGVFLVSAFN